VAVDVILPKVDMDMTTGRITKWFVTEGATVTAGDPLFEIETDKAAMEIEAPASGTLAHVSGDTGVDIAVGASVAWIYTDGETIGEPLPAAPRPTVADKAVKTPEPRHHLAKDTASPHAAGADATGDKPRATPLARRLAADAGIALDTVKGSGPRGRITRSDIEQRSADATKVTPAAAVLVRPAPHFTLTTECQIDALITLAAELTASAERTGDGREPDAISIISVNELAVKALAATLQAVPDVNVSWTGEAMVHHSTVDIAVAMAVTGGQMYPVIRRAQSKSVLAICGEMAALAAQAQNLGLEADDLSGGTTGFCNLGMPGVARFGEHLNPAQSTSLTLGVGERRPVYTHDGAGAFGKTFLTVTISADQRLIDGPQAARMLEAFKRLIEEPLLIVV